MATIKIKGFVHAQANPRCFIDEGRGELSTYVLPYKSVDIDVWGPCLGAVEFDFELPEGMDPKAEAMRQQIEALHKARRKAEREFSDRVTAIDRQLAELQAITYQPAEA